MPDVCGAGGGGGGRDTDALDAARRSHGEDHSNWAPPQTLPRLLQLRPLPISGIVAPPADSLWMHGGSGCGGGGGGVSSCLPSCKFPGAFDRCSGCRVSLPARRAAGGGSSSTGGGERHGAAGVRGCGAGGVWGGDSCCCDGAGGGEVSGVDMQSARCSDVPAPELPPPEL